MEFWNFTQIKLLFPFQWTREWQCQGGGKKITWTSFSKRNRHAGQHRLTMMQKVSQTIFNNQQMKNVQMFVMVLPVKTLTKICMHALLVSYTSNRQPNSNTTMIYIRHNKHIWFIEGHMDATKSRTLCQQAGTGLIDSWVLIRGAYCTSSGCDCWQFFLILF